MQAQLEGLGLTEKEAKVYLSLLELGESSVNEVARGAEINRSSVYPVLESLEEKGLVVGTRQNNSQLFKAASPEKLVQIAEASLRKQQELAWAVSNIVPNLKSVHKEAGHRPVVKVYSGVEGIKRALSDTLEDNKEKFIRVATSLNKVAKLLPPMYFPNYVKERHKHGVQMRSIHPNNNFSRFMKKLVPMNREDTVVLPEKDYMFSTDFGIYDDKVIYLSHENGGYAITIEDQKMAETMKELFDMAWGEAYKLKTPRY